MERVPGPGGKLFAIYSQPTNKKELNLHPNIDSVLPREDL